MRFHIQTFGCKSNQYDSQGIRERLLAAGHSEAPRPGDADLFILNTCGVTGRAAASCRNALRKAARANPRLRVAITGCGVDLDESWPALPGGRPLLVPNAKKHALADMLTAVREDGEKDGVDNAAATPDNRFGLAISAFHGRTRAFLKIQDGCDNHCSYCAVPRARGAPQSRPPADILAEAARLTANGHRELVLTGINIGAYDRDGVAFPDLVRRVADTPGLTRLRLGSVEPPHLTPALAAAMRDHAKICPHLHIPLQSGDDGVLGRMNRRYTAAGFLDKLAMLRSFLRLPAVTSDIIAGFPTEDEPAFLASLDVCRQAAFSRLHVFPFSPRPGTPAAVLPRAVPDRTAEEWKNRLIAEGRAAAAVYAAACVGLEERVIPEGKKPEGLSDRYLRVRLDATPPSPDAVRVIITAAAGPDVCGRALAPGACPHGLPAENGS